jgi:hypothetical protein
MSDPDEASATRPTVEDRLAIHELIALYGHIADDRDPARRPDELFAPTIRMDTRPLGGDLYDGLEAVEARWTDADRVQAVMHHQTNIVLTPVSAERVDYVFKGLGVGGNGRVGSVRYDGQIVRLESGWRFQSMNCKPMRPARREEA